MSQVAEVFEINTISKEECWHSSIQELPCHRVYNNYTPARRAPALQTRAVALQRQPPAGEEEDMLVSLVSSRAPEVHWWKTREVLQEDARYSLL